MTPAATLTSRRTFCGLASARGEVKVEWDGALA